MDKQVQLVILCKQFARITAHIRLHPIKDFIEIGSQLLTLPIVLQPEIESSAGADSLHECLLGFLYIRGNGYTDGEFGSGNNLLYAA